MPRITAPTVAEHRDMRRASLLAAARELLREGGSSALTMGALATATGLSRPTVYEYFPSTDAVIAHLVVEEMRTWHEQIDRELASAPDVEGCVRRYVRRSLTYVADGHGSVARALEGRTLPAACRVELDRLGSTLAAPLEVALRERGVADPGRTADLVHGVVLAAARRIERGASATAETRAAERFALAGLET
jgi:AcrR family transcriptional regulator